MDLDNNEELKRFSREMESAIEPVGEKYRMSFFISSAMVADDGVSMELKITAKRTDIDADRLNFEKYCDYYLIGKEFYKQQIEYKGDIYEFIGFNLRSRKRPCQMRNVRTEEVYSFSAEWVREVLGL